MSAGRPTDFIKAACCIFAGVHFAERLPANGSVACTNDQHKGAIRVGGDVVLLFPNGKAVIRVAQDVDLHNKRLIGKYCALGIACLSLIICRYPFYFTGKISHPDSEFTRKRLHKLQVEHGAERIRISLHISGNI